MDPRLSRFVDSMNGFEFNGQAFLTGSDQYPNFENGLKFDSHSPLDLSFLDHPFLPPDVNLGVFAPSSSLSPDGDSSDDGDSDSFLKYVSQVLMEENLEDKACMFHDPLALQAAEKSFYDVLGGQNPTFRNQTPVHVDQVVDSPDDNVSGSSSDCSSHDSPSNGTSNWVNRRWSADPHNSSRNYKASFLQNPLPANYVFGSALGSASPSSINSSDSFGNIGNRVVDSSPNTVLVPNIFSDSESMLQFKRGVEEASKFLPKAANLIIDLENGTLPPQSKVETQRVVVKTEKVEWENSPKWSRGRKNRRREDIELEEGRSRKQSAIDLEEDDDELVKMFDKVLLSSDPKAEPSFYCTGDEDLHNGICNTWQVYGLPRSNGEKTRIRNQSNGKEVVDFGTLLIQCAQAVSADDHTTANELLKLIRQHSSPFGDGSQRLAHCFADGLEARLAGTGTHIYTVLASKRVSAAAMLKAYELFLAACPFKKISAFFANHMILRLAEKATVLHVIDFGILYGFHWPAFIRRLSARPGGPPKLRITGIELPQPGLRPAERVEETGRRLAKYCERFNVPFEYNAIAQKWETIRIEDLKIDRDEAIAVNCMFRSKNLLDESIVVDSPRNAVLGLIRKINPHIFIHSIINGSYNAPFFVTRFREALFHFSAVFDVLDNNAPRDHEYRLMYEKEFCGREVMNVIACEGSQRVERPETYKQWQVRTLNAGFRQLPLDQELTKKLKTKVKVGHHKDFLVDEDRDWMLQGWKGRVLYASSCWIPA